MEFNVRPITSEEREKFFQLADDLGSVFSSSAWISMQEDCMLLGIFRSDGQLSGGCALKSSKLKIFKILTNPGFAPHCGFFLKHDAIQNAQKIATLKSAMNSLISFIDQLNYPLVDISFDPEIQDVQVFQWRGFRVHPAYTYRLNLSMSEEELWNNVHSSRRNRIKKLEAEGLRVNSSNDVTRIASIINSRLNAKAVSFDSALFQKIIAESIVSNTGIAMIAEKEGQDVASSYALMHGPFAYYLFGGTSVGSSDQGASLSLWKLILESKKRGVSVFDFEGSMLPGIEQFFRSFGGELVPYYRIKKASLWMEGLLRIFKRGYWD